MKEFSVKIDVRYGETDQMGVVHHSNYAQYFELARIEWLDALGISYSKMEKEGLMLPVYEMEMQYLKPAHFGDTIEVEVKLKEKPGVKICFEYVVKNQEGILLNRAKTILVFMDAKTRRPIRCPEYLLEVFGY